MLIRSQDKKTICNLNNTDTIAIEENSIYSFNGAGDSKCIVGKYSTEEKAIKVLDMIQDAYEEANSVCSMSGFVANTVFQMPQDSEV